MDLCISIRVYGDRVLISASGEIDLCTAPDLRRCLLDTTVQQSPRIVLDLSKVTFMDAAGLSALVEVDCRARNAGGFLRLAGVRRMIARLLRVTGLHQLFDIYGNAEAALDTPLCRIVSGRSPAAARGRAPAKRPL